MARRHRSSSTARSRTRASSGSRSAGLDAGEIELLLRSELGVTLSRRTLERVRRASGGNLFFALEIGRALVARGGPLEPAEELPIPANLQELVRDRLELLPPAARAAAQVASALSRPTVRVVDGALAGSGEAAAAVAAGVLEQDGERLAFAHPLLATVAYQLLSAPERCALHAQLAEILDDPEERARHLALAATKADEAVATALDEAARRAAARGAPDAAADLLEQARRLTPAGDDDERRRRGIEAAERHFEAGEVGHARALLEEIVGESPHGERRARALVRLGWVCAHEEGFSAGADVFFAALSEPADDVRLRIEIFAGLGWCLHSTRSVPDALEYAHSALALAEQLAEPTVLAGALALVAFLETLGGEGVAMATIERALALEHSPPWSQVLGRPDWIHGLLVGWSGALASAREAFSVLYREALDRGDEHSLPFVLFPLARFEFLMGDWTAALAHARECQDASMPQRPGRRAPVLARDRGDRRGAPGPRRARPVEDRRGPRARRAHRRPARRARVARDARVPRALARRRRRRRAHARRASPSGRARPASSSRRSSASTATRSRRRSRSAGATRRSGSCAIWSSSAHGSSGPGRWRSPRAAADC